MTTRRTGESEDHAERGSSTAAALGIAAAAVVLLGAVGGAGHLALMGHRAATAADLAALAAADAKRGIRAGVPCEEAERSAEANGARVTTCEAAPGVRGGMDVSVRVELAAPLRLLGPARAVARAGPPGGEEE
ncbi:Rv3654c family TadE-like protein [Rothia halotolerans]|uniref:Rv3654c family TadE-like protein n=1 Tax=Rothia halotolerans TaxID=405770 RepID=UPI00101B7013|nr:Rv3654c family TadE-like protein [Rothia halotolerans]